MKITIPVALMLLLAAVAGCQSSSPPAPVSKDRASTGMPPTSGTLPNGVIENSVTK